MEQLPVFRILPIRDDEDDEEMQQENGGGDDGDDDNDDDPDGNDVNYIRMLIGRELAVDRLNDHEVEGLVNDNWNQQIRTRAIRYIRRMGRLFQFSKRTLYRSVIYLDRFLAYRVIANGQLWAVRLIAVACLSLSAKMNDNIDDVPPLSDYPVGAYNISVNAIQRMEILVLVDFNWNMYCVTPFDFRIFFMSRFCRDVTRLDITRITTARIIMSVLRDIRLMNHRPSVIAAAATLVAVNRNFTIQELVIEINALPINGFLQINARAEQLRMMTNSRTATGEHSLDKLHTLLSDLESRRVNSESFSQLKEGRYQQKKH